MDTKKTINEEFDINDNPTVKKEDIVLESSIMIETLEFRSRHTYFYDGMNRQKKKENTNTNGTPTPMFDWSVE
ncbi:hypothetical protein EZS27_033276 [termite gut metagenome]|uniref:Uncharacterized protein n=1 Tax=termite gut metagenome TaxID=433724 RepID=A0A5J4Q5Z6_9ZZZZ